MEKISQHPLNFKPFYEVMVAYSLEASHFVIHFELKAPKLFYSEEFSKDSYSNWKLWEYDVAEVFLTKDPNNGYLELQVSPLAQKLAVLIKRPREDYDIYPNFTGLATAEVTKSGFNATFHVPLSEIPGEGSAIFGNLTACLGAFGEQSYFSLIDHPSGEPDFHRPDLFKKLV